MSHQEELPINHDTIAGTSRLWSTAGKMPPLHVIRLALNLPRFKHLLLGTLGIVFVAIGAVGVVLPGIPTVGPLIAASYCLAKYNPDWERKLIRSRIFRNYAHYLDGSAPIPMRARVTALIWMWGSIVGSSAWLIFTAQAQIPLVGALFLIGMLGTMVILRLRRHTRADSSSGEFCILGTWPNRVRIGGRCARNQTPNQPGPDSFAVSQEIGIS